ncbi:MAG: UDP-N-acetylglucosamine 1-carboxyvinyltransferase [Candidatus Tectomicrobia bacterium]|nr:UDP-N-acetylglucosamine 1-carboxyvinyltransferase [Candidatus Tectomicrobia bacterium]
MECIEITGGRRLCGEVQVSGAKNAALPLIAATLLMPGRHALRNVPRLRDVTTIATLLEGFGVAITRQDETLFLDTRHLRHAEAPYDLVRTMRASILVLGPLLARLGRARVSLPGGCAIGARPVDQHLKGLAAMGAEIALRHGYIEASASRLRGVHFTFDIATVTGTENLLMAAALAEGTTVLENAAREPEVQNLAAGLRRMGCAIEGDGTPRLCIEGRRELRELDIDIIPDRVEAGTLLIAAAITGGTVTVRGCRAEHLGALLEKLEATGARLACGHDGVSVTAPERLRPVDITTLPYPGFPTDLQAQAMALLSLAAGDSVITETVFENRLLHTAELRRMGANIRVDGRTACVRGVPRLEGATVMATDLRASACLVLAGLAAANSTRVLRVYHLDRGYERLDEKLAKLGADIRRVRIPQGY